MTVKIINKSNNLLIVLNGIEIKQQHAFEQESYAFNRTKWN